MTASPFPQSGNVIIYVLGAIFLMGLVLVMVKGGSGGGSGIDTERQMMRVSEVQQYGGELEKAIAFILENGYSETDIRFAHPNAASTYGDITDDPARQVFDPKGGGATWHDPPAGIQAASSGWIFNAKNTVEGVGTSCQSGNRCTDLVAFLPNVTQGFCLAVNAKDGIENPSDAPPVDNGFADVTSVFTGDYNWSYQLYDTVDGVLFAQKEGCFEGGGTPDPGTYHYYRVLLAR